MHILVVATFMSGAPASAAELRVFTETNPPLNFLEDQVVRGLSTDVLLAAFERAGVSLRRTDIRLIPWPRAYQTVLETPGTALYSMARMPEREPLFLWAGPLYRLRIVCFAPKTRDIRINTAAALSGYRYAVVRDGAPGQLLKRKRVPSARIEEQADLETILRMLRAGRVDMIAFNELGAIHAMKRLGMNPGEYRVAWVLTESDLCVGFNRKTDPSLVRRINTAIAQLKEKDASGVSQYERIVERYLR